MILVRLGPGDREWISRSLRSTFGDDELSTRQRLERQLRRLRGYGGPMTVEDAHTLADLLAASRLRGGPQWTVAMDRLERAFRTEHVNAIIVDGRWQAPYVVRHGRCPLCGGLARTEPIGTGGHEWFCANCNHHVLPEGEA